MPDLNEARRFLAALAPGETEFTFQTFDDTEAKRSAVVRVLHGTLDDHAETLAELNARRAGVFVTVNAGNGQGRTTSDILRVRAVWVDLDFKPWHEATEAERAAMPAPSLDQVHAGALAPHIVVQSSAPTKWHCYWLVDGLPLEKFTAVQKRIISRFAGADASINDLPRVMRLPGFIHHKGTAALTQVLEIRDAPHYTAAQILAEFPPLEPPAPAPYHGAGDAWVIPALQAAGLYVAPQGDGKHSIRCPWEDGDHTTTGSVYFEPGARGKGTPGFKCFSCEATGHRRTLRDLKRWLGDESATAAPLTDVGNLLRFTADHGENVRYCKALDTRGTGFFIWSGNVWKADISNRIKSLAIESAQKFRASIETESNPAIAEARRKWLKRTESAEGIAAVIGLAQADQSIAVTVEQLNAAPFLLTVQNGTLDLKTGALREAQRADLITRAAPVTFDPAATCPQWESQMARTFAGDADLIAYIRRVLGSCLTGIGSERFFVFHGGGANGKSTLTGVLEGILGLADQGGHAGNLQASSIEPRRDPGAVRNDLAGVAGARAVLINEPKRGVDLDEGMIKALTTPDSPFKARALYAEFFTFYPTFKIFLSTNHRPGIRGTDDGTWRRVHYIPFTEIIPAAEQITGFSQKLLRDEGPGILNWMLTGCRDWLDRGGTANALAPPDKVTAATAAWRATADLLTGFLEDNTERDAAYFVQSGDLLQKLNEWLFRTGTREAWTPQLLAEEMEARGFRPTKRKVDGKQARGFAGLRLPLSGYELDEIADPST